MRYSILFTLLIANYSSEAQFKIGTIEVDSKTAQEYFSDCYSHPDTVSLKNSSDYLCKNCTVSDVQVQMARQQAVTYNEGVIQMAIGKCVDDGSIFYPKPCAIARKPSEQDFIKWQHRRNQ